MSRQGCAGKRHEVPAHHNAEAYVGAYLMAAQIANERKGPLFRSLDRRGSLTERRLLRLEVLAMIKRRARQAGLPETICCHTFRARIDRPILASALTRLRGGRLIRRPVRPANENGVE